MDLESLVKETCTYLSKSFPNDPCRPGMLVSLLENGIWYVAAHRYTEGRGEGKVVVAAVMHVNLIRAVLQLRAELDDPWPEVMDAAEMDFDQEIEAFNAYDEFDATSETLFGKV